MDRGLYENYLQILSSELIPALGCTEPIAIAYAAAKVREALGKMPESITVDCSGNIIKNVKGVTVPNSGGLKGIDVAAVLGVVGGAADKKLEVLNSVTKEDIEKTKELVAHGFCKCGLIEGKENLDIIIKAVAGDESALVEIRTFHTNVVRIEKNGEVVFSKDDEAQGEKKIDKSKLNVKDILVFADEVAIEDIEPIIKRQIDTNRAICDEGLKEEFGAQVGRTILKYNDVNDVRVKAKAMAAAGSDARMSGCALPVVINSGSGNQGLTVSIPVIVYAEEKGCSAEELYRALVVSNLISLHQKRYIGDLSAYCGATSAGCGAACGIAYLDHSSYEVICGTIINSICTIGGMVCDGAKSSCAGKIASSVETGMMAYAMAKDGHIYGSGEGLVGDDIEGTISNIGRMGKDGMKSTDVEILNIMLGN
ncbi:MAG: L-serine ammonia-lyase, iron-sulfur-dependent, subunit alpha [Clostridiales bacterium]|nr:L-serine ammonia-lyase, iron-sulfur-dependent, subunit alpha [Clostridiales bacterium]